MEWDDTLGKYRPFPGVASGGYMVEIVGGKHYSTPGGDFVEMSHGKQYSLRVVNSNNYRCRLQITVDGTSVGSFQIDPKSEYELERPADKPLKFAFYRVKFAPSGSGITKGKGENGLITCAFTPEAGSRPAKICVSAPTLIGSPGFTFNISDQAPADELIKTIKTLTEEKFRHLIPRKCKNTVMVQWRDGDLSSTPRGFMPEGDLMTRVQSIRVHDYQENYFSLLHLESLQIVHDGDTLDFDLDNNEPTCYNIFKAVLQHKKWGLKEEEVNLTTTSNGRILLLHKSASTVYGQRHIYLAMTREEAAQCNGKVKLGIQREVSKLTMNISIKALTGKTIRICDMIKDETVYDLKLKIQDKEGIPPDQQRLILGGRQLDEGRTVGSCGICDESVLHMVLNLRGGGDVTVKNAKQDNLCALGDNVKLKSYDAESLTRSAGPSEKKELNTRDASWCAGATTLQGASSQKFQTVPALRVDPSLAVILTMRLVARSDEPVDPTQYEDLKCTPLSKPVPDSVPE